MAPIPKTPSGVGVPVPGAPAAPSAPAAPAAPSTPADPPAAQAAPNTSWVAPKKAPRKRDLQAAPRPPAMRDIGGPAGQVAAPLPNAPNAPTHPKTKKPSLGQELGHIAKDFLGGVASAFEDAVRNTQVQVNIGTPPGFPPGHPAPLPPLPPGQAVRKHDIPPDATAPIVYADPPAPPLPKSGEPAPAPLPKTVDQPPAPLPKTVDQPPAPVKTTEPLPAPSVAEPGPAATAPQALQLSRLLGRYIAPGPDIAQAQAMLNELGGAQLETDGKFGPLTEAAVRKFQTDNGLKIDGVIGPQTQGKLNELAAAKAKTPPPPAAPAEPAEPAAPAGPATPAEPATPAGPATPAEPVTPAGPTAPATPSGAVDPDTQLTFDRNGGLNAAELTAVAGDVNQDMGLPRAATAEQQAMIQKYADPAHFEAFAKSADTQKDLQEFVNLAKPPTPEAAAASKQEFLRGLYEAKFANEYANAFAPKPDTNVDTDTMLTFDKNGGPKPLDLGFEAAELMGKTETVGGLPELSKEQLQFVRDFGANDKFAKFASDPKVQEALQAHVAEHHRDVPAEQLMELKQSWLKGAYIEEFKKEFAKAFPNDVKAGPPETKPVPDATPAIITQVKVEELPLAALAPDPVKLSADMALEKIALAQEQGTNDVLPNGAQLEFTSQYATPENFARFAKRADVQAALTKHLEGKKLTTAGEANQAAADFLRSEFSTQFRKDFRAKFGAAKAKPTVSDDELRALRTELEAAQAALAAAVERQAVMQRRLEAWLRPAA